MASWWLKLDNTFHDLWSASHVNTVGDALKQSFFKNIITRTTDGTAMIGDPTTSSLYDKKILQRAPLLNESAHFVRFLAEKYSQLKMTRGFISFSQLYNELDSFDETLLSSQEIIHGRLAKL